jgi:glucan 1,3-beta-glucosidase
MTAMDEESCSCRGHQRAWEPQNVPMWRAALTLLFPTAAVALDGTINRAGYKTVATPLPSRRRLDDEPPNPYTCPENHKSSKEQWHVQGTNLGGWLVLEPWITPSLFYQFLSSDDQWGTDAPAHTGMDTYTFCQALGPEEGNKQLRRHWKAWLREEDIAAIAKSGANTVRIPIGDWMYAPYEPYVGCTDGALEELHRALRLCAKYKLKALLDVHALRGSQNGFDNSGQALDMKWTSVSAQTLEGITTFEHWPIRAAHWPGHFDLATSSYPAINWTSIDASLDMLKTIIKTHKDDPAVWGLEPVNEPWQFIPIEVIKKYYWDAYHITRKAAPHWMFVMHDSFRGYPAAWWDFMKGCPNKVAQTSTFHARSSPPIAPLPPAAP